MGAQDAARVREERKAAGEDILENSRLTALPRKSNPVFRYMKAIPTAELCLACHGTEIDPAVSTTLKKHYPLDQATGFQAGDIRGAFYHQTTELTVWPQNVLASCCFLTWASQLAPRPARSVCNAVREGRCALRVFAGWYGLWGR
ncbi:MAG: DUF3365 domain-containing protein [Rhodospirillales bacterium]|nr:DUF3365 domain-containing protein [Rhodospirillales bacterium]